MMHTVDWPSFGLGVLATLVCGGGVAGLAALIGILST
jgi:hypothetical protein